MFLSLDEWRTENTSAAEILLQPQTGRLLSNFEAVDGGHPGIGYSLLYNPDIPEEYDGRIRIILKNRIRPQFAGRLSGSAAQQDIFSAGGYTAKGGAPQPLYGGHGAGFMVNIPHLDGVPFEVYENEVGYAIAQNPSVPFWNVQGAAFTSPPSAYLGTKKGALHPYIGMAGRPILEADLEHQNNNPTHVFFDDPEAGQNNSRPPNGTTWASQQIQDIYLVDFSGTEIASVFLDRNNLGQPIFFKDGPNFYFPGHLEDAATGLALPTKFATNGGVAYSGLNVVRLKVIPGLKLAPPPFRTDRPVMESNQVHGSVPNCI